MILTFIIAYNASIDEDEGTEKNVSVFAMRFLGTYPEK
jgi:hypothetical protein